jgi:hemerythrin-like domain-containing protein
MLERLLLPEKHAIAILMKDHDVVKELFDRFEKAESVPEKEKIIAEALTELKIHAAIEEEIFYPAVRKQVGKDLMNEADEEHHVARVLIAELDLDGKGNDHRDAKFTVLSESVRHHIKEEEGEMLPKAKSVEMDFEALGQQLLDRKKELRKNGIPSDAEHSMVATLGSKGDSPAAAARRTTSAHGRKIRSTTRTSSSKVRKSSPSRRSRSGSKSRGRPGK